MNGPGSDRTLVDRAFRVLREGPVPQGDLARRVLRLSGSPGTHGALMDALLGADARFRRDAGGNWSLADGAERPGERLDRLRYAVVDVETTGGTYADGHRLTEIAIVQVAEGRIQDVWHTLVHPGRAIPRYVQGLTGITAVHVGNAPFFEDIAEEVLDRLRGRVFVAHNVRFDWGFVTAQLGDALGEIPGGPRLCTVRMARHLVPAVRRRGLDGLADHFDLPIYDRHRAHGDAWVTARILIRLLDLASRRGLHDLSSLQEWLRRPRLQRDGRGSPGVEFPDPS